MFWLRWTQPPPSQGLLDLALKLFHQSCGFDNPLAAANITADDLRGHTDWPIEMHTKSVFKREVKAVKCLARAAGPSAAGPSVAGAARGKSS